MKSISHAEGTRKTDVGDLGYVAGRAEETTSDENRSGEKTDARPGDE